MTTDRGEWIQLTSGTVWYPAAPAVEDVRLADMFALARTCRHGNGIRFEVEHYSVAQHCVHVANELLLAGHDAETAFLGLIHDAHEAYPPYDVPAPLKSRETTFGRAARLMEDLALDCVRAFFGASEPTIERVRDVKVFDLRALATEKRDLVADGPGKYRALPEPFAAPIVPLGVRAAWKLWIGRLESLAAATGRRAIAEAAKGCAR